METTHTLAARLERESVARGGRRVGGEYAPAGSAPLTREQKAGLARLARRAWIARGMPRAGDAGDAMHPVSASAAEAAWRHEQAVAACGLRISQATQRDYAAIRARFLDLLGESGEAVRVLIRDGDNPRRIALHKLAQECGRRGLAMAYPDAICRRQYRVGLGEASAAQVWRILFTVKNRRKKK